MTTNTKNLREYADSARRAYVNSVRDVYPATECSMYLAEYKLALTEAYGYQVAPFFSSCVERLQSATLAA